MKRGVNTVWRVTVRNQNKWRVIWRVTGCVVTGKHPCTIRHRLPYGPFLVWERVRSPLRTPDRWIPFSEWYRIYTNETRNTTTTKFHGESDLVSFRFIVTIRNRHLSQWEHLRHILPTSGRHQTGGTPDLSSVPNPTTPTLKPPITPSPRSHTTLDSPIDKGPPLTAEKKTRRKYVEPLKMGTDLRYDPLRRFWAGSKI